MNKSSNHNFCIILNSTLQSPNPNRALTSLNSNNFPIESLFIRYFPLNEAPTSNDSGLLSFLNSTTKSDWIVVIDECCEINFAAISNFVDNPPQTNCALFYSDELASEIDKKNIVTPVFKPKWSPHLAINFPYYGPFLIFKKSKFPLFSNNNIDFLSLASYLTDHQIGHISEPLYIAHYSKKNFGNTNIPKIPSFINFDSSVLSFINSRYPNGEFNFSQFSKNQPDSKNSTPTKFAPLVSIIIPTRDKVDLLKACIDSIFQNTSFNNYEIIIIDNNSIEEATSTYFGDISKFINIKIIKAEFEFNWSKVNNLGASNSSGEFLIFLNNDTIVISSDWISQLCSFASLPDVAVVGPLLLFPDNTIQHAGVVVGMGGWADHVYKCSTPSAELPSIFIPSLMTRNVLAVTGACLTIQKFKFLELGLFDEEFIVCGSDVEICIRAHKLGYFNIYTPNAKLYHLESKTRSTFVPEKDFIQSDLKYRPYRIEQTDPYYNKNLSIKSNYPIANY